MQVRQKIFFNFVNQNLNVSNLNLLNRISKIRSNFEPAAKYFHLKHTISVQPPSCSIILIMYFTFNSYLLYISLLWKPFNLVSSRLDSLSQLSSNKRARFRNMCRRGAFSGNWRKGCDKIVDGKRNIKTLNIYSVRGFYLRFLLPLIVGRM